MKKLFISCPMKGRTEENIRKSMEKMHRIAEMREEEEKRWANETCSPVRY